MKKYILLFVSILSFSAFVGCSDDDGYTPPNYVTFGNTTASTSVLQDGNTSFDMTVYTANIVGQDRTVDLNVLPATTLDAAVYSLPSTVTIPANSNEATFTVELSDTNLPNTGGKLVLGLGTMDEDFLKGGNLTLNVARVCPFDLSNFVGSFAGSEVFTAGTNAGYSFYGGAQFPITLSMNPDDASGNSLVLNDANGIITDGTVLTFDQTTGKFTIPAEGVNVVGFPLAFSSSTTDTCNGKLTFTGDLGPYGQYTVTLVKL